MGENEEEKNDDEEKEDEEEGEDKCGFGREGVAVVGRLGGTRRSYLQAAAALQEQHLEKRGR